MLCAANRVHPDAQPFPSSDPNFANVVYLLQTGGSNAAGSPPATDVTGKSITNTGSVATEYGGMRFSNTGTSATQYLTTPNSTDFTFGSGAFTIECDIVIADFHDAGAWGLIGQWLSSSSWLLFLGTNTFQFIANNGAITPINITTNFAWTPNTRYHIAVTRSGSTWRAFRNGALLTSATDATTLTTPTESLVIGKNAGNGRNGVAGLVDRVRITKGVARYTAAFTPNFHPYPTA